MAQKTIFFSFLSGPLNESLFNFLHLEKFLSAFPFSIDKRILKLIVISFKNYKKVFENAL
jgi:hypothetical protein